MGKAGKASLLGLGLLVGAIALSGCVVFKGPIEAKQIGHKKKVKVTFTLCNSDDEPGSTCPDLGNSEDPGETSSSGSTERVLLGFRVPKGTKLPKTISPLDKDVVGEFSRFRAYKRALNQEAPKGRRFKWLGYGSSTLAGDDGGADTFRYEEASFEVKMKLPRKFDDKWFKFRPVVGWQFPGFGPPGSADPGITCGPALYERVNSKEDTDRVCIDSPSPKQVRKSIKVKIKR